MWLDCRRRKSETIIHTHRLEAWATQYVGAGTGTKMLLCQSANEVLRHCKIGRVTKRAGA